MFDEHENLDFAAIDSVHLSLLNYLIDLIHL